MRSTSTSSAPIPRRPRACRAGECDAAGPLVKEMGLQGISGMATGNAFLPAFMAAYNARFAKPPFDGWDLHRLLAEPPGAARAALSARESGQTTQKGGYLPPTE